MIRSSTIRLMGAIALCALAACGRSPLDHDRPGAPVAVGADAGLPPCATGLTQCGKRNVSLCYDLATSKGNCGACGHACAPGIACQAGTCQHSRCAGPLTFQYLDPIRNYASGPSNPYSPALGDFDGDGFLDLAGVPDFATASGVLSGAKLFMGWDVLYGVGDGTFASRPRFEDTVVEHLRDLAADLDGDGILDLVSLRADLPGLSVRRGSGRRDAPFRESVPYPTSQTPDSLLVADLDYDGYPDLVAGVKSNLEHWRGLGDGRFQHQATLAAQGGHQALQAVDWNGDGALDLMYGYPNLHLRYGRGDGTFDAEVVCGLALSGPAVAPFHIAADLDHDNTFDLVALDRVYLGVDNCNVTRIVPLTGGDSPGHMRSFSQVADLNGDGNLDIVSIVPIGTSYVDGDLVIYMGDGEGGFSESIRISRFGYAYGVNRLNDAFLIGDVNRDAKLDVIVAQPEGWQVLLNVCQ